MIAPARGLKHSLFPACFIRYDVFYFLLCLTPCFARFAQRRQSLPPAPGRCCTSSIACHPVVDTTPPEEVRQLLEGSQNTIALLLLLLSHYVVTHIVGISAFFLGTVLLVLMDRRVHLHADARVRVFPREDSRMAHCCCCNSGL